MRSEHCLEYDLQYFKRGKKANAPKKAFFAAPKKAVGTSRDGLPSFCVTSDKLLASNDEDEQEVGADL